MREGNVFILCVYVSVCLFGLQQLYQARRNTIQILLTSSARGGADILLTKKTAYQGNTVTIINNMQKNFVYIFSLPQLFWESLVLKCINLTEMTSSSNFALNYLPYIITAFTFINTSHNLYHQTWQSQLNTQ